jgi:hypothetical protein
MNNEMWRNNQNLQEMSIRTNMLRQELEDQRIYGSKESRKVTGTLGKIIDIAAPLTPIVFGLYCAKVLGLI